MFEEMMNHSPNFGHAQQVWSNMSPWGDILLVLVVTVTLAVLVGATVWGGASTRSKTCRRFHEIRLPYQSIRLVWEPIIMLVLVIFKKFRIHK